MIGIYKITSPTGKIYIGQSWDITQRRGYYSRLSCKRQPKLYASLVKYKWDTHFFEVVCELPEDVAQSTLDQYEIFYWQQYLDCGFEMMNTREPGVGGRHTQETRQKMSQSFK